MTTPASEPNNIPSSPEHRILPRPRVHGLPREVTSFVGRQDELSRLETILTQSSLITLTGTGGVGKTRLAIRLAAMHAHQHPDGVWFIQLTDISEDSLVEQFVDRAMSTQDNPGDQTGDSLIERLAGKRVLIILDNCEHVLDGAAQLAYDLIHGAPGVQIIATSRESLKVLGETVFEVQPLSEAVQLFIDRAGSASPGFHAAGEDLAAIAKLCERLDGLPLAIELAAVRVRALSPNDLLSRQEAFFDLLAGGNTGGDQRHQTLRGAIQWSYDLCSNKEKALWTRLTVFAGGFEVDAVEEVCTGGLVNRADIPLLLSSLVDKSVLSTVRSAGRVRYRMLESIRSFGIEELAEAPDGDTWYQRHLNFHVALAELSEKQTLGVIESDINTRLRRERTNLEAAVTHSLATPGQERTGMRLIGSLWFFWNANGHLRSGQFWLSKVLAADATPSPERAKCLWVLGWFHMIQGDNENARKCLNESINTAELVGDRESRALAIQFLGTVEHIDGNPERAVELLDFSISEHDAQHDSGSLPLLGIVQKAFVYCLTDASDRAIELSEAAIAVGLKNGEQFSASWAMWTKGMAHWSLEQYPEAKASLRQALEIKRELHDWLGVSVCLDVLAWVAVRENRMTDAATLWGEGRRFYGEVGSLPLFGSAKHVEIREAHQTLAATALGTATFARYFDDAAREPATGTEHRATPAAASGPGSATVVTLTSREREISALVAQGLSNREIAGQLVLSIRTVEGHVQNLLNKLGFHSRQALSEWFKATETSP